MEIELNFDNHHEGPKWWAEVVDKDDNILYYTTWYNTKKEAKEDAEQWKLNTGN